MLSALAEAIPSVPVVSSDCSPEARMAFFELEKWCLSGDTLSLPIHEVECDLHGRCREVMRLMLQSHLDSRGREDVGAAIHRHDENGDVVILSHRRKADRDHRTVFGRVEVRRLGYSARGEDRICPADETLRLQERSYSYEVQRLSVIESVKGPYEESVKTLERYTGLKMSKRTCEDILQDSAVDFKEFYQQRVLPSASETSQILVASVDGKGVPMKQAKPEQQLAGAPVERRTGVKKMATVATAYTVAPRVRTPEEVVDSLFKDPHKLRSVPSLEVAKRSKDARPEYKRVWASLDDGKDTVIGELAQEAEDRDPDATKTRVALTDGEAALQRRVRRSLPTFLLILDLLHALDKLWKAAAILVGESKTLKQEREEWVRTRVLHILQGNVSRVVRGMRQSLTKRQLKGKTAKQLRNICNYLYNNRDHMRYQEYLATGLPIASGAIEGACKNLVKARMEGPGMRWCTTTEAMLRMRALYLSGDFEEYWAYHIRQSRARLRKGKIWTRIVANTSVASN